MRYDWKLLEHDIVYDGYFRIERLMLDHEKYGAQARELFADARQMLDRWIATDCVRAPLPIAARARCPRREG